MKKKNSTPPTSLLDNKSQISITNPNSLFKKIFYVSLCIMLGVFWVSGYDISFHSDEMDMNVYAKRNISYYTSGGKDTSYLLIDHGDGMPSNNRLRYYTCGFDYIAIAINTAIGNYDGYEYNIRHALNQLFAVLALFFAGFTARTLSNFRAAVITIWLIFLTPIFFGLALFDTKDIPFCAGYIASVYFLFRFLKGLPTISWRVVTGLIISIAFTCSIRIGGLLLLGYLACFTVIYILRYKQALQPKESFQIISILLLILISVVVIMVLGWPYALANPMEHLREAFNVAIDFPQNIPINFSGEYINSTAVPKNYVLVYIFRTVPVIILIAFFISLFVIYTTYKKTYKTGILLLMVAMVFPVIYVVLKNTPVYNSWRHLLFIYPPGVIIISYGMELLLQQVRKPAFRYLVISILIFGMLPPILWAIENHPFEYMYYNQISGGFKNNYYDYETDYWQISTRRGLEWLIKHESILESEDTVLIGTNSMSVLNYYIKKRYPDSKIQFVTAGYHNRMQKNWTYGIFGNQFLPTYMLENSFPPKYNLIYSVEVDGLPITAVIKDTIRYDMLAMEFYNRDMFEEADSVFTLLIQQHQGHFETLQGYKYLLVFIAFSKYKTGQYDAAQYFAEKAVIYDKTNYEGFVLLGVLSLQQQDLSAARKYTQRAVDISPDEPMVKRLQQALYYYDR